MSAETTFVHEPLSSLADVTGGVTLGRTIPDGASVELPYLRVANVQDGYIDTSELKTVRVLPSEVERFAVRRGDVLLTEGGDFDKLGRGAVWDGRVDPCLHQNHLFRVRCDPRKLLPEFLALYLASDKGRRYFLSIAKQTTNLATINSSQLKAMPILVPPMAKQRRIVEVLGAVAEQERAIEAAIVKLELAYDGVVEEDLSRHEWAAELKDALSGNPRNGYSPTAVAEWTGMQMLGLGCLTPRGFEGRQLKNAPPSVARTHFAVLKKGDLLMSRANTRELVGLAGLFDDVGSPCIYPDLMMRLPVGEGWSPRALEIVLRSAQARRQIQAMAQGTSESMVKISGKAAKTLRIPNLNHADQVQLVRTAEYFEERLAGERQRLVRLGVVKQGLAHDLLSGRMALVGAA